MPSAIAYNVIDDQRMNCACKHYHFENCFHSFDEAGGEYRETKLG